MLSEARRVLKPGGRMAISDMVSEHPVREVVAGSLDAVAGSLPIFRARYLDELRRAGFADAPFGGSIHGAVLEGTREG